MKVSSATQSDQRRPKKGRRSVIAAAAVASALAAFSLSAGPAAAAASGLKSDPIPLPVSVPGTFVGDNSDMPSGSSTSDFSSQHTKFWSFTAASTQQLSICTYASAFGFDGADTTLEVWSGPSAATWVGDNDDADPRFGSPFKSNAGLSFNATSGTQYVVGLGGFDDAVGSAQIHLVEGNGDNACKPSNSITGVVRGPGSQPLSNSATSQLGAWLHNASATAIPVPIDADGSFAVPSLPSGNYQLTIMDASGVYRSYASSDIAVAGQTATIKNVELQKAGTISGVIRGSAGVALTASQANDLSITATDNHGDPMTGTINSNGSYSIPLGLVTGTSFTLQVTDVGGRFKRYTSAAFNVPAGASVANKNIELRSTALMSQRVAGKVAGSVKAKKGKKVALPKRTSAGVRIRWVVKSSKFCKFKSGKLVLKGKRGKCRVTAYAPSNSRYKAMKVTYTVRLK
ncbi:MAG: carboxypeptidase-like regulatory domain-containing protein [Candidatus Nanopelagicales bacterium]